MKYLKPSMLAGLLMVMAGTANALPVLSFDDGISLNGGTLSYDGTGGSMTGSDINFTTITGFFTSLNAGIALDCIDCSLDFTTGANITEGPSSWTFGSGGTMSITGKAYDGGIAGTLIASGTLLTGNFYDVQVFGGSSFIQLNGFGFDTKNVDLLDFYGISSTGTFEAVSTNVDTTDAVIDTTTGAFTATVSNADLVNTVPEPSIIALLGLGLAGFGLVRRKA